jgi:hypothetical protein
MPAAAAAAAAPVQALAAAAAANRLAANTKLRSTWSPGTSAGKAPVTAAPAVHGQSDQVVVPPHVRSATRSVLDGAAGSRCVSAVRVSCEITAPSLPLFVRICHRTLTPSPSPSASLHARATCAVAGCAAAANACP